MIRSNKFLVKLVIFLSLVVLAIFGYAVSKELGQKKQVNTEIESLKNEAQNIQKENMNLSERISYLGSKDYQDLEAKDKLNLQGQDEKVVVITQDAASAQNNSVSTPVKAQPLDQKPNSPNYQKWWDYFFGNR